MIKWIALFILISNTSHAEEILVEGNLKIETRQFVDDNNDETFETQYGLLGNINIEKEFKDSEIRVSASGRYDVKDSSRQKIWAEDVYFKYTTPSSTYLFGYKIFNLSYMEAFNSLDVMNAKIFDVSIVKAQKLGELALGGDTSFLNGTFSLYFLPNPTRPFLPGTESRLNLAQELNRSIFLGTSDSESDWDDHFFAMYEKTFDRFDAQFVFHKGIDRTRVIIGTSDFTISGETAIPNTLDFLTPYYYERYLSGASIVYNFDEFQIKSSFSYSYYLSNQDIFTLEGMKAPVDHSTGALGFEKNLSHLNNLDSQVFIEYQYQWLADEGFRSDFALQNDLFVAWKLALNDLNSKEITVSLMRNLESKSEGFNQINFSQRIFLDQKIELGYLAYIVPKGANLTSYGLFKDAEHLYLNWSFYM